jgi:hypothetical protein
LNSSDAFALPRIAESKADSNSNFNSNSDFDTLFFGVDILWPEIDRKLPYCSPPSISVFEPLGHRKTATLCLWKAEQRPLRIDALSRRKWVFHQKLHCGIWCDTILEVDRQFSDSLLIRIKERLFVAICCFEACYSW